MLLFQVFSRTFQKTLKNQEISHFPGGVGALGQIKSSDHYKIYANPLLNMIDDADLGIMIGPVTVNQNACTDDEYLITAQLDIGTFCGKMYRVKYDASKTKITVFGSNNDRQYYSDVSPWRLDGKTVKVSVEHEQIHFLERDKTET